MCLVFNLSTAETGDDATTLRQFSPVNLALSLDASLRCDPKILKETYE
ncbi:hypothetical protein Pla52o_35840 [Novipirellula galeiformis]|uniref:Uncharacterized protein n=1 Tax=Novipirellula galeiformis TaxID=2528004 RepID=A0A5C6CET2_9BACT|nr:hypothetical protein Pla52o_35840 [Novipirellula galeiformis]